MSERKKHIAVLNELLTWMEMGGKFLSKDDPFYRTNEERKEAVKYAISSLEADEAYNLMYEDPDFCEDCISRESAQLCLTGENLPENRNEYIALVSKRLRKLPSILPNFIEPPRWISVSKQLPEESTAVLVWCPERKNIYCAYYEEKQWWIFGAYWEKITLDIIA